MSRSRSARRENWACNAYGTHGIGNDHAHILEARLRIKSQICRSCMSALRPVSGGTHIYTRYSLWRRVPVRATVYSIIVLLQPHIIRLVLLRCHLLPQSRFVQNTLMAPSFPVPVYSTLRVKMPSLSLEHFPDSCISIRVTASVVAHSRNIPLAGSFGDEKHVKWRRFRGPPYQLGCSKP